MHGRKNRMALSESFQKALLDAAEKLHLNDKIQSEWARQTTALENALRRGLLGLIEDHYRHPAVIEDPDEHREQWMFGDGGHTVTK